MGQQLQVWPIHSPALQPKPAFTSLTFPCHQSIKVAALAFTNRPTRRSASTVQPPHARPAISVRLPDSHALPSICYRDYARWWTLVFSAAHTTHTLHTKVPRTSSVCCSAPSDQCASTLRNKSRLRRRSPAKWYFRRTISRTCTPKTSKAIG